MFKIGDFSKLSSISIRMLRHYDNMELLRPEKIDAQTGYRYYSAKTITESKSNSKFEGYGISSHYY